MPIYEYSCRKCGEVIEKIQKFSDGPLRRHAGCGGALSKLVSQSSFQLKGSGWYVTDYAGKGKAEENSGSPSDASPDKGPDKGADKGVDKGADKNASGDDGKTAASGTESGSDAGTRKKSAKDSSSSQARTPKAG
jgi:putative FmdB family regulatory protein